MKVYVVPAKGRKYLQLRWTDDNGKTRQKSAKTSCRRDAERVAARLEAELREQRILRNRPETSWELCRDQWYAEHVDRLAKATITSYHSAISSIEDLMAPKDVSELTDSYLADYVTKCIDEEHSPNTIKSYLRQLNIFFGWLLRNERIERVPQAKSPRAHQQAHGRPLNLEEFERILKTVPLVVGGERSKYWKFDLWCLWYSGLRINEAFELQWNSETAISIQGLSRSQPMIWTPANEDKSRRESLLPAPPDLVDFLRRRTKKESRTGHVLFMRGKSGGRYELAETAGKLIAKIGRVANVISARDHKGEPVYASAHDLRRSFGTRWASEVEAPVLQQMMRHESIHTTMSYYAHVSASKIGEKINAAYARQKKVSGESLASQRRPS